VYTGLWWGNLSERDHLEDPDVDGRIMIYLQEVALWSMGWINLV